MKPLCLRVMAGRKANTPLPWPLPIQLKTGAKRPAPGAHAGLLWLAPLLLAGCAPMLVEESPRLMTPSTYVRSAEIESEASATMGSDWQSFFGDAQLKALIATALTNNRDLAMAVRRVDEARAQHGIARSDRWPTVTGSASASRSRTPANLSPSGSALTSSQYEVALGVSAWEIDLWGRVRSLTNAALASYLATDEARRAVQVALIKQVAASYLTERELDERIDIAERSIAARRESARIAQRRFEVGSAARMDALQAQILLGQARTELAALQRQYEQNHNALELLVGGTLSAERQMLSDIETGFLGQIVAGLPSDLLVRRPDLREAEGRLTAANTSVDAARAAFFPRIALTGSLGTQSHELADLFKSGSGSWGLLPSISVPLLDHGRNQASLDLAHARRGLAITEYERRVQSAFREVADALADRHWLNEQIEIQRSALTAQRERRRIAGLRYTEGAGTYLEVLDAERELFSTEQSLVQTRKAYLVGGVNLYAALGGGDPSADEALEQKGLKP